LAERLTRTGQVIPDAEWERVRERLPGYSIVLLVDEERQLRAFHIVDPADDCSDRDYDGRTLTAKEAADMLKAQAVRPMPAYLQEELRLPWATRS
jgi:hypothetical protein